MNDSTLITVHCYAGDAGRVVSNLACYLHHDPAPVVIMSPEDSPVIIPGILCRQAGKRAYIGQDSLDRQRAHLRVALEYPFQYFLMNDSDSVCVSPEIPKYLYEEPKDIFWSNEIEDPRTHPTTLPRLAFQPPYFLSREALERIIWICDKIRLNPITPYIDHFMLQLVCEAGLKHRSFRDMENPSSPCEKCDSSASPENLQSEKIRNHERVMLHPVKTLSELNKWRNDYARRDCA